MGKLRDLTKNATSENVYVEIPKLNLESVIVSNETVHEITDKHYRAEDERYSEAVKARAGEDVPQGLEYLYPKTTFQRSIAIRVRKGRIRIASAISVTIPSM